MKKTAIVIVLIAGLAAAGTARAEWYWQRISENPGNSFNPALAAFTNNVRVFWSDEAFGNYEIFYKRSQDYGSHWSWQRITDNSGTSRRPAACVRSNSSVHVVWEDATYGPANDEIFHKRSTDFGNSWSFQRLTDNSGWSGSPAVAGYGSDVHVVWQDSTYTSISDYEIFYKRSTDRGATWSFQRFTNNTGDSEKPAVAASGSNVHVVWEDNTNNIITNYEIFYKRSTDQGATWSFQRLTDNSGSSRYPDVAVDGTNVHVVWTDWSYGNYETFYKHSTDNGATWSFQRLSANSGQSLYPAVAATAGEVFVVWGDDTYGYPNFEIFSRHSTDNGTSWAFERLSDNTGISRFPDVAIQSGYIHVVWEDNSFGNFEIFYKMEP
jgi:hypothetical protein